MEFIKLDNSLKLFFAMINSLYAKYTNKCLHGSLYIDVENIEIFPGDNAWNQDVSASPARA